MAEAINLDAVGLEMRQYRLARLDGGRVVLHEKLAALDGAATEEVLMTIAALLLAQKSPTWLHSAMASGHFQPELVPFAELSAIGWLGDDIEPLLAGLKYKDPGDDLFRTWLGRVGESLVVTMERKIGASVRHVSLISDHFGYDVESVRGQRYRLEVKTSIVGTEHRLFLTRNEVSAAGRFFPEWFLVQVVLKPTALTASTLTRDHVERIRQLPSSSLIAVLPQDSKHCRWVETVELTTAELQWAPYLQNEIIPTDWITQGASASIL